MISVNDIAFDTTRTREELAYKEPVSYEEGLRRTGEQILMTDKDRTAFPTFMHESWVASAV